MNKTMRNMLIPGVVAVAVILIPAMLIQTRIISGYPAQILTLGALNAILAISVNMVCGITGQLSLGQAGFEALGAYAVVLLSTKLNVPLPVSVLLGGCVAALFGFLIGFPTLKLEGDYLAIVTLAFCEIIRAVMVNLKNITGGPNGMQFSTVLTTSLVFGATISYLSIMTALVLIVVLLQNFLHSTYGRAILAVREDEVAANSNGISVFRYKMIGFVIASFIAGIAGALYAPFIGFIQPKDFDFNASINDLIFVVLGGMGSITGGILAAFVLTALQEILRFLKDYRLLIYPVILIFVMLFRPQGLLGTRELSFVNVYDGIPGFFRLLKTRLGGKKSDADKGAKE